MVAGPSCLLVESLKVEGRRSRVLSADCCVLSEFADQAPGLNVNHSQHSALSTHHCSFARWLVEWGLDLLGANWLAPDDDVQGLADAGDLATDEGEADALAERGRVGAAGDVADGPAIDLDLVARARRAAPLGHAEADEA